MHILIVPSERYVPMDNPLEGVFQRDQALALKKAGFKVGVISPDLRTLRSFSKGWSQWPRGYQYELERGIPLCRYHGWNWIPHLQQGKRWLWLQVGVALFKRYLSKHGKPEVIHAHNARWAGILASRIKRIWNIPYVLTEHSSVYGRKRIHRSEILHIRESFRNAGSRLVVSPHLGHLLQETIGDSLCPWQWVPNVLDELFEQGRGMPLRKKVDNRPFLFLNVGALIEVKGQDQLLIAFAEQFRERREVQLRIGGNGPLRRRLEALIEKLGITNQVTFLGEIQRQEVLSEMQRCDVYVHSSRYETFGVTLIEALSCGKPVISTACGGPECIVQKTDGILVPPNDPSAFGRAMGEIMDHVGSYDPASIRRDCLLRFGQKTLVDRLSHIYQGCVAGIEPPPEEVKE